MQEITQACIDMCMDTHTEMRINMKEITQVCIDMRMDMRIDVCIDMQEITQVCTEMRIWACAWGGRKSCLYL